MVVRVRSTINTAGLKRLEAAIARDGISSPFRSMFNQWAKRYEGFVRRRFVRYSRGGGDWKPLAESTIRRRRGPSGRGRGGARQVSILRDTGLLFNALTIGGAGNLVTAIPRGVRYGFAETPHAGSGTTIAKIAGFHQTGAGKLPRRAILVQPDDATVRGMMNDLGRAIRAASQGGAV